MADAVELLAGILQACAQPRLHILIEMLEQQAPGLVELMGDALLHLLLQGGKGGIDLFAAAAALVEVEDASLKVDARFDLAEDLVGGPEDPVEEVEFLLEQLIDALVGLITAY